MASLDKEIKVLMLKGERGQSSYEEAVANGLFSGTLEEWIETYATPEDYITRNEFVKLTQAEYDELEQQGLLVPNTFYLITDDTTYEEFVELQEEVSGLQEDLSDLQESVSGLGEDVSGLEEDVTALSQQKIYSHTLQIEISGDTFSGMVFVYIINRDSTLITNENIGTYVSGTLQASGNISFDNGNENYPIYRLLITNRYIVYYIKLTTLSSTIVSITNITDNVTEI